jgi:YggT family protein
VRLAEPWLDFADVGPVASILDLILFVFLALMLIRLVVDWVQVFARSWTPSGPVLVVLEVVYSITDPPIRFVRRFVPPLRLGSVMLDTSFLIVLVVVYVLRVLVARLPF